MPTLANDNVNVDFTSMPIDLSTASEEETIIHESTEDLY